VHVSRPTKALPFGSNFEHVEAELAWLRARCARLAAQARLAEVEQEEADLDPAVRARPGRTDARLAKCRVREFREDEDRLRAEIDARILAHRRIPNTPVLGLLVLERDHGLIGDDVRTVMLVALAHALGSEWEERILGSLLPSTFSGPDVSDMIRILDPVGLEGHVKARSLFRPRSMLMRSGLLVLDDVHTGVGMADTLLGLGARLTLRGFAVIMQDEDALTEGATASVTNGH
jgi:hypothetical protein